MTSESSVDRALFQLADLFWMCLTPGDNATDSKVKVCTRLAFQYLRNNTREKQCSKESKNSFEFN